MKKPRMILSGVWWDMPGYAGICRDMAGYDGRVKKPRLSPGFVSLNAAHQSAACVMFFAFAHAAFHPLRCLTTFPSLCIFLITAANSLPNAKDKADVGCHPKVLRAFRISFFIVPAFRGCCLLSVTHTRHQEYRSICPQYQPCSGQFVQIK